MYTEKAYKDVQALSETEETKPMIETSRDLFGYTIDKEKNGYLSIAAMKDAHVQMIRSSWLLLKLNELYQDALSKKYDKLMELGKGC